MSLGSCYIFFFQTHFRSVNFKGPFRRVMTRATLKEQATDRAAKQLCMRHLRPSRRSSARKSWLEQHIPNERSIVEKWRYFVDFLHDFQSFSFQRRFIYLRGIAFSRPYRWNFRKVRDFPYFIDPLLRIVSLRAAFSRHGLLTSR